MLLQEISQQTQQTLQRSIGLNWWPEAVSQHQRRGEHLETRLLGSDPTLLATKVILHTSQQ